MPITLPPLLCVDVLVEAPKHACWGVDMQPGVMLGRTLLAKFEKVEICWLVLEQK